MQKVIGMADIFAAGGVAAGIATGLWDLFFGVFIFWQSGTYTKDDPILFVLFAF